MGWESDIHVEIDRRLFMPLAKYLISEKANPDALGRVVSRKLRRISNDHGIPRDAIMGKVFEYHVQRTIRKFSLDRDDFATPGFKKKVSSTRQYLLRIHRYGRAEVKRIKGVNSKKGVDVAEFDALYEFTLDGHVFPIDFEATTVVGGKSFAGKKKGKKLSSLERFYATTPFLCKVAPVSKKRKPHLHGTGLSAAGRKILIPKDRELEEIVNKLAAVFSKD